MAQYDIMPTVPDHWEIMHFPLDNQATTFLSGEPVALNVSGNLEDAADPIVVVAASGIVGIAAAHGDKVGTGNGAIGTFRNPGFGDFSAGSGLPLTGDILPVWIPKHPGARLIGRFTNGGTAFEVPTQAEVGDPVGLEKITAGNWAFSNHATPEKLGRVVDVLDADMNPISVSGAAGVYVVVALIVSALTSGAVAAFAVPAAVAD